MPYKNIEDRRAAARRSAKKRREANREKFAEESRKYYQANKERLVETRRKRRKSNPEKYEQEKRSAAESIRKGKRETKIRLVKLFGGKCKYCGVMDDPCIYDFHHRNPTTKESEIARLVNKTRDWGIVLKEAQKCDMVCSNCHRKIHIRPF